MDRNTASRLRFACSVIFSNLKFWTGYLLAIVLTLGLALGCKLGYHICLTCGEFISRMDDINAIIEKSPPLSRERMQELKFYAVEKSSICLIFPCEENIEPKPGKSPKSYFVRHINARLLLKFGFGGRGQLRWHLDTALWTVLLYALYSEDEAEALWRELVYFKGGRGLNNAAIFHYGRDVNELSPRRFFELLLRIHYNNRLNCYELQNRTNYYLEQYQSGLKSGQAGG